MSSIEFENNFWLEILSDHMTFLSGVLAPSESKLIDAAMSLKSYIDKVRNSLKTDHPESINNIIALVKDVIDFKRTILAGQLGVGPSVNINYPPTSVQHLIDEANMYMFIVSYYRKEKVVPSLSVLKVNKFWVDNASEHISDIYNMVDPKEKGKRHELELAQHKFEHLIEQTEEYLEHYKSIGMFPAVNNLIGHSINAVNTLNDIFAELEELRLNHLYASTIPDMLLNHMIREHLYYINKIQAEYPTTVLQ